MTQNPDLFSYLRLARSQNIGSKTFFQLLEIFSTAKNAIENLPEFVKQNGGSATKIKIAEVSEIERELENIEKFGAKIITFEDENYPAHLKEIPDPDLILTCRGDLEFFNKNTLAIVGARNSSLGGINFAKKIANNLAQNEIVVASGLARGIDSAAHEAAINFGTIAVIAGSIDNVYPKENKKLYDRIFEQGLVITEMPFGSPPKPENFIRRNRIVSGLSLGVVVIEAGLKSGSLTTARFALEQGREVFAVPGSPFDERCRGSNLLIKQGAKLIENIEDILEEFEFLRKPAKSEPELIKKISEELGMADDNKKISLRILEKLSHTPIAIEELIAELQIPFKLINIALMQLELLDKIEINFGKINLKNHD